MLSVVNNYYAYLTRERMRGYCVSKTYCDAIVSLDMRILSKQTCGSVS